MSKETNPTWKGFLKQWNQCPWRTDSRELLKAWRKYSDNFDTISSEIAVVLAVKGMHDTTVGGRISASDARFILDSITVSGRDFLYPSDIRSVIKCTTDKKALAYLECLLKVTPTDKQLASSIR